MRASWATVPSAGVVREAHRPLLVWRKHKACLIRHTIRTHDWESLIARQVVAYGVGAWVRRRRGRVRGEDGLPNIHPTGDAARQWHA